jgi:hypothetical protein
MKDVSLMLRANKNLKRITIVNCPNFMVFAGDLMEALASHQTLEELLLTSPDNKAPA